MYSLVKNVNLGKEERVKRRMYQKELCSISSELSFACEFRVAQWRKKKSVISVIIQDLKFWIYFFLSLPRKDKVAELRHKDTSMGIHCIDFNALK